MHPLYNPYTRAVLIAVSLACVFRATAAEIGSEEFLAYSTIAGVVLVLIFHITDRIVRP